MAVEKEKSSDLKEFGPESASAMVEELRRGFATGKTRSFEWRESQLKSLLRLLADHEPEIVDALRSDLSKPELESIVYEVARVFNLVFDLFLLWFL